MSKTNDTLKLGHAKLENRALADSELDAVSGGDFQITKLMDAATPKGGGGGGATTDPIGAWNRLLHQYGF